MNLDVDNDDMAADIRSAFAEASGVVPPEPADIKTAEATETIVEPEKAEKTANRDEMGKFVAKQAEPAQDNTDQPSEAVADPASKLVIRAPASWSPAAKSAFESLPPDVQQAVAKREQEIDHGLRRKAEEAKRYEPLEGVIAPHRQKWAVAGVDEATAVKQLLAASDWLDRNPTEALQHLARQYGVNIASLGQPNAAQPSGETGQPQAQPDPVASELQALKAEVASLRQGREQETQQTYVSQIDAFAADTANLYFENVKPAMAALLQSGQASTLPEAYERAIWSDPTIRPILLQQQATERLKPTLDHARKAKAAGVSVTGSPGNDFLPTSNGSIEDDVRLAVSQVSGRA